MSTSPPRPSLWQTAREIRRRSDKPDDFAWARYATRPYAALLLAALDGRIAMTPNGVSVASLFIGLASCAAFACWPGAAGLWAGWLLGQASYTVDCMDGMLARWRGLRSPVGVEVDFLVDAIKQVALFPAVAWRLWLEAGQPTDWPGLWPVPAGLLGAVAVAAALMMTTFLRAPALTGAAGQAPRPRRGGSPLGLLLRAISFAMNYPSWILLPVALGRMDAFLLASLPLYVAYCGYAGLQIARRVVPRRHYDEAAARAAAGARP